MTFAEISEIVDGLTQIAGVETRVIGESVLGRPLRAFFVGKNRGRAPIIIGAIHAREWITAPLVAEMVKTYAFQPRLGGIWFVPLCNPDGVEIALGEKTMWKSNARGVDLNVNFDADWGTGAKNVTTAGAENFIGTHAESEPETRALVNFVKSVRPKWTIAYHSKGRVIYYGFKPRKTRNPRTRKFRRDEQIARTLGNLTGYAPERTANSAGGFTDWVSAKFGVPAFTLEVGSDDLPHPIGMEHLPKILSENANVPLLMSEIFDK
jgi:g-D-glutamyl-meso-diaminopimelate peptidase